MGIISQEIKELRAFSKRVDKGTISTSAIIKQIAIYNQIEKRMRLAIQIEALRCMAPPKTARLLPPTLRKL